MVSILQTISALPKTLAAFSAFFESAPRAPWSAHLEYYDRRHLPESLSTFQTAAGESRLSVRQT